MVASSGTLLQTLQPWAPVIAAAIAAFVAILFGVIQVSISLQQAATAKNKLKFDLFEKRWKIYIAAIDAIRTAIANDRLPAENSLTYSTEILGAQWILDEKANEYLTKTLPGLFIAFELSCINLRESKSAEERKDLSKARIEARNDLFAQLTEIDSVFAPHLQLES